MRVNELIEERRKQLNLSKAAVSDALEMTPSNYSWMVSGKVTASRKTIVKAYYILGIPADDLLKAAAQDMIESGHIRKEKDYFAARNPERSAGATKTIKSLSVGDSIIFDKRNELGRFVALEQDFVSRYRQAAKHIGCTIGFVLENDGVRMTRTS